MPKLLAIDYGTKRTGIAVTDDSQIIASGLTTIDTPKLFEFLDRYFKENEVTDIILGSPKKLDGSPTHSTEAVMALHVKLKATFGKPVHLVDERFTSKMAFQAMIDGGLNKRQRKNKALIDEISATIILQSYMDSNRFTS